MDDFFATESKSESKNGGSDDFFGGGAPAASDDIFGTGAPAATPATAATPAATNDPFAAATPAATPVPPATPAATEDNFFATNTAAATPAPAATPAASDDFFSTTGTTAATPAPAGTPAATDDLFSTTPAAAGGSSLFTDNKTSIKTDQTGSAETGLVYRWTIADAQRQVEIRQEALEEVYNREAEAVVKVQRSRHAHGEGGILALLKQLVFDQMRLSQLKAELDIIESDQHEAEEKVLRIEERLDARETTTTKDQRTPSTRQESEMMFEEVVKLHRRVNQMSADVDHLGDEIERQLPDAAVADDDIAHAVTHLNVNAGVYEYIFEETQRLNRRLEELNI